MGRAGKITSRISDRIFILKTALLTVAIHAGLRVFPFQRFRKVLAWLVPSDIKAPDNYRHARRAVQAIERVQPWVGGTCLDRALTLQLLMARKGQSCDLRIGVSRSPQGEFKAHAWVESEGRVLIGGDEKELAEYSRMPAIGLKP